MISNDRLTRAIWKAAYGGVQVERIRKLLTLAGAAHARDLPLNRRRDFLEVLTALQKQGREP